MLPTKPRLIVICGPTAVGKTDAAIAICKNFDGEVISTDSRQLYRELSIGTAKPTLKDMDGVPHHFIDSHYISEDYTAGRFEKDALQTIDEVLARNKLPVLVGGSGLYIQAVLQGLDAAPANAEKREELESTYERYGLEALQKRLKNLSANIFESIDQKNYRRLIRSIERLENDGAEGLATEKQKAQERPFDPIMIGLYLERAALYERINTRVDSMIAAGLVEEVRNVHEHKALRALQTVGYRELFHYLDGDIPIEEAIELIKRNSRRYAKRQLTWFRKMTDVHWLEGNDTNGVLEFLKQFNLSTG